jgi:hypothetical protein
MKTLQELGEAAASSRKALGLRQKTWPRRLASVPMALLDNVADTQFKPRSIDTYYEDKDHV